MTYAERRTHSVRHKITLLPFREEFQEVPKFDKTTLPMRIKTVGTALFGPGRGWTVALARGLNMSRSQLFEYRIGRGKRDRDIDGEMLDLIDRERDANSARGMALTKLRNRLLSMRKEASDAA
ncbi:hypothetical protein [Bradyrhizobium ottawaense]|uniref:hypothetical protein n=1 Tax=Bradyrhizobium ottawaense TaxID=931866 RepID=UPI003833E735